MEVIFIAVVIVLAWYKLFNLLLYLLLVTLLFMILNLIFY